MIFCEAWQLLIEVYLMVTTKNERVSTALRILLFAFLLLVLPPLVADGSASATYTSAQPASDVIKELKAARATDWNSAHDPSVSLIRHGTFLNQMNKADRAIKEIEHGFPVSQSELDNALWVPPKHISPQLRAKLIQELEQAKHQDNINEQRMLYDSTWDNAGRIDTVKFDRRKHLVDSTVEDLEIGAPVHWSNIKLALVAPPSPY
jgi:hypothetical protein